MYAALILLWRKSDGLDRCACRRGAGAKQIRTESASASRSEPHQSLAHSTRPKTPFVRNEDPAKGAEASGQEPEKPAWREATPAERISRPGSVATPGQPQVLALAEVGRARVRATRQSDRKRNVQHGDAEEPRDILHNLSPGLDAVRRRWQIWSLGTEMCSFEYRVFEERE